MTAAQKPQLKKDSVPRRIQIVCLRESCSMTLPEVARIAGVAPRIWKRWEARGVPPLISAFRAVHRVCDFIERETADSS